MMGLIDRIEVTDLWKPHVGEADGKVALSAEAVASRPGLLNIIPPAGRKRVGRNELLECFPLLPFPC